MSDGSNTKKARRRSRWIATIATVLAMSCGRSTASLGVQVDALVTPPPGQSVTWRFPSGFGLKSAAEEASTASYYLQITLRNNGPGDVEIPPVNAFFVSPLGQVLQIMVVVASQRPVQPHET